MSIHGFLTTQVFIPDMVALLGKVKNERSQFHQEDIKEVIDRGGSGGEERAGRLAGPWQRKHFKAQVYITTSCPDRSKKYEQLERPNWKLFSRNQQ